jgi:hypothetical protein
MVGLQIARISLYALAFRAVCQFLAGLLVTRLGPAASPAVIRTSAKTLQMVGI